MVTVCLDVLLVFSCIALPYLVLSSLVLSRAALSFVCHRPKLTYYVFLCVVALMSACFFHVLPSLVLVYSYTSLG